MIKIEHMTRDTANDLNRVFKNRAGYRLLYNELEDLYEAELDDIIPVSLKYWQGTDGIIPIQLGNEILDFSIEEVEVSICF